MNDRNNIERCIDIENKCKNIMENAKVKEQNFKKEINDLNNVINQLKEEKEKNKKVYINNEDLIKKNKELTEKNNELTKVLLGIRNNFKNIEKDKNDNKNLYTLTFTYDNTFPCNCCYCPAECILCEDCYKCNCICHCQFGENSKSPK